MHDGELAIIIPVRNAPLCRKFAAMRPPRAFVVARRLFDRQHEAFGAGAAGAGFGGEQLRHPSAAALQRRRFRMQTLHGADESRVAAAPKTKSH